MRIAIVIPTFNRKEPLRRILQNLTDQQETSFKYQIVVVVDGSTDGTLSMLEHEFPSCHVICGDGSWFWTRSLNEGLLFAQESGMDGALHLNDDLIVREDYLCNLERSINANSDAVIGSLCLTLEEPHKVFFAGVERVNWVNTKRRYYYPSFSLYYPDRFKGLIRSIVLPGRGMFIPMSAMARIGLLDQVHFPQYKSDADFALRAVENGIPVYLDYDAVLYSDVTMTGAGASFQKEPFGKFIRGFWNNFSHNSVRVAWYFYKRHAGMLFLWSFALSVFKRFITYFKTNYLR